MDPGARDDALRALWARSAQDYGALARRLPTYVETNQALVDSLDLRPGHRVLDLACGGGATLEAAFAREPRLGEAWAVDWVPEMAAQVTPAGRPIRTVVAPAQRFAHLLGGVKVDRVVCNGAFFQFEAPARVLGEIAAALEPGGKFGFTLPGPSNTAHFVELFHRLGLTRPLAPSRRAARVDTAGRCTPDNVDGVLRRAGWILETVRAITVRSSKEDYVRWLTLPVFRRPEWLGRERAELEAELTAALEHTDEEPALTWLIVVARPEAAPLTARPAG